MEPGELLVRLNDEDVCNMLVMLVRFVASAHVSRREDHFLPFILGTVDGCAGVVDFRRRHVEAMGEESDHIQVVAVSEAFQARPPPLAPRHTRHTGTPARPTDTCPCAPRHGRVHALHARAHPLYARRHLTAGVVRQCRLLCLPRPCRRCCLSATPAGTPGLSRTRPGSGCCVKPKKGAGGRWGSSGGVRCRLHASWSPAVARPPPPAVGPLRRTRF